MTPEPPHLPRAAQTPTAVVAVGMVAFAIAAVVLGLRERAWTLPVQVSVVGLGVGLFGTGLFLLQLRGARRGDKGAQQGLDDLLS